MSNKLITIESDNLDDGLESLAEKIKAEIDECRLSLRTTLDHARRAGEFLNKAKTRCKEGNLPWEAWVRESLEMSERTAQMYMQIANSWERLKEAQGLAPLGIEQALKLLAKPNKATKPGGDDVIDAVASATSTTDDAKTVVTPPEGNTPSFPAADKRRAVDESQVSAGDQWVSAALAFAVTRQEVESQPKPTKEDRARLTTAEERYWETWDAHEKQSRILEEERQRQSDEMRIRNIEWPLKQAQKALEQILDKLDQFTPLGKKQLRAKIKELAEITQAIEMDL